MSENENIGSFIREKLQRHEVTPSSGTWQSIERNLPASPQGRVPRWKWGAFTAGLLGVVAVIYFAVTPVNQEKSTNTEKSKQSAPIAQVDSSHSQQKTTDNKPEKTEIGNKATSSSDSQKKETGSATTASTQPERETVKIEQIQSRKPKIDMKNTSRQTSENIKEKPVQDKITPNPLDNETLKAELPAAEAEPLSFSEDREVCVGKEITLWASGGDAYTWMNGSKDSAIEINPKQYDYYTVTVVNSLGKEIIHEFDITVKECGMIFVPNAFTPNSDGRNDQFRAYGVGIKEFRMQIRNRAGNIIFETENINEGWDGNYNDRPARPGVYLYRIVYVGIEGETKTKSGTLTLIR